MATVCDPKRDSGYHTDHFKGDKHGKDEIRFWASAISPFGPIVGDRHYSYQNLRLAETWVQLPSEESLLQALAILGSFATMVRPAAGSFDLSGYDTLVDELIGMITRHPMRQDELERTLEVWSPSQVHQALKWRS